MAEVCIVEIHVFVDVRETEGPLLLDGGGGGGSEQPNMLLKDWKKCAKRRLHG